MREGITGGWMAVFGAEELRGMEGGCEGGRGAVMEETMGGLERGGRFPLLMGEPGSVSSL